VDIKVLNNSFITLIPKVNNPTIVNDFMPVSLMNSVVKIITKLLGERIQSFIIPLVHPNQYGFIKSRTIQDCLAWAFEYIHQCQHSKRKIVIIKLDFTKAFDTIEHSVIIQMMQSYGFQEKWIEWTTKILGSATT
jgi:retron-type reverse transcriptase